MQDYLEMIYRLSANSSIVRISTLAAELHVRPSSASKMASNLADAGYILYARYGYIRLAEKGQDSGAICCIDTRSSIGFSALSIIQRTN